MISKNILVLKENMEFRIDEIKEFIYSNKDLKCTLIGTDEDIEHLKEMLKDVKHEDLHFVNHKYDIKMTNKDSFGLMNASKFLTTREV